MIRESFTAARQDVTLSEIDRVDPADRRCPVRIGGTGIFRKAQQSILLLVMLLAALSAPGRAEPEAYPHQPVNLSFFYPISTNRNPEISTNFRLNLIYGDIGSIRGVDINGLVGRVRRDMVGLQATGAYSHIGGELRGVAVTGLATYVESDAKGIQYSGFVNFNRGDFTGYEHANLFNYVEGDLIGVQTTGLLNLNDGDVKYCQLSSIGNAVAGDFVGAQVAGGMNYVNQRMHGGQLAMANFAKEMKGIQVGLGNIAGDARGVQVGVVNIASELDGVPVGVINYTDEGDADWVTFGSNLAAISTGVRTIHRRFYSFLAVGVGDLKEKRNDTAFISWHYGYAVPVSGAWKIGIDAGYLHIVPTPSDDPEVNTDLHYAIQGRVLAEYRISEKTRVFGGAGFSTIFSEYSSDASSETDPLVVLGISLY